MRRWQPAELKAAVIASQHARRTVDAALRKGTARVVGSPAASTTHRGSTCATTSTSTSSSPHDGFPERAAGLEPGVRIELTTSSLQVKCSAD